MCKVVNLGFKALDDEKLGSITGGFNWGTVIGSCAKGALLGVAFGGNAIGGCAVSAGFDVGGQLIRGHR
ncbi:hypothetical protein BVJ53_09720 [Lacticaseibacillus chiayiensis]|uniref:TmhB bacteriocin enhancer peptide n=1 Tax=Lacticaseibacillus chiayiensis TaxID=2100821 RepID=A0A4Q1TS67_9LACO|nr:TmhB bacteriocin enhancer peptide [Lacticaseibacillus chiayiensis]QVI34213.1 TmhB bacteriocin enhancer peptide [Lacticaseibacillus chiayiensis]RXT20858.1 hypothetical protein BVJ53_09720 [Lacticaseibacillus chiayiensis]RXT57934.1 hypothetical protein CHT97_09350 [Lacticaseibacillus chiayiensis]UYN55993.1 TmhB bacteriocin enhancer peptide [Lacticaseibacillus chiayiensis]